MSMCTRVVRHKKLKHPFVEDKNDEYIVCRLQSIKGASVFCNV